MSHEKKARAAFENGRYEQAGAYYTQAVYASLSRDSITEDRDGPIAAGLSSLLRAAYCYRRAGLEDRARNRCRQGVLIASDLRDHSGFDEPRYGILTEYVGDFRTLGDLDGAGAAYERASELYASNDLGTSFEWPSNPLVDKLVTSLTWMHVDADESIPADLDVEYEFLDRLSYKQSHLPSLLEREAP